MIVTIICIVSPNDLQNYLDLLDMYRGTAVAVHVQVRVLASILGTRRNRQLFAVALSELASRVGEEMIVKRVYSVYGQYTQKTQNFTKIW